MIFDQDPNLLMAAGLGVIAIAGGGIAFLFRSAGAKYTAKPLLNKSEHWLYSLLERWRRANAPELNLSTQVNYNAFINAGRNWRTIGAKHCDFLIWDQHGLPKVIIEYDGRGHFGNNAATAKKVRERDSIKDRIARSSSIPLMRIRPDSTSEEITETLNDLLKPTMQKEANRQAQNPSAQTKTRGKNQR